MNLANNHSSDYGEESLTDTKSALDAEEIVHFGFEDTALVEVQGVKVGLLGMYTVYTDDYIPTLQRLIGSLQDQGAQVIVPAFTGALKTATPRSRTSATVLPSSVVRIGPQPSAVIAHEVPGTDMVPGTQLVKNLVAFRRRSGEIK